MANGISPPRRSAIQIMGLLPIDFHGSGVCEVVGDAKARFSEAAWIDFIAQ